MGGMGHGRHSMPPPPPGAGGPNAGYANGNYPPPPEFGRHSGSVNSQDPILNQNQGQNQGQGQHSWAYSNGNGGQGGPQQPQQAHYGHGSRPGWVDESMYNGPNYGANQAWGR